MPRAVQRFIGGFPFATLSRMPPTDLIDVPWDELAERLAMSLLLNSKFMLAITRKKLPGEADLERKLLAAQIVKDLKRGGIERILRRQMHGHGIPKGS